MNVLQYFSELNALWINVDAHTDRAERFERDISPMFKSSTRMSANPIVDVVAEANEFSHTTFELHKLNNTLNIRPQWPSATDIYFRTEKDPKVREWAATRSLTITTYRALTYGLDMGWDRFIMFDDDAFIRRDMLHETPLPPEDSEFSMWGGGYLLSKLFAGDNQAYENFVTPKWERIRTKDAVLCTHAYEMTRKGAEAFRESIREHYGPVDHRALWYTHGKVTSYALRPNLFAQGDFSRRGNEVASKFGSTTRSEV